MYETILRNEFRQYTSQELSDFEMTALKDYIEHYGSDNWEASDLRSAVCDFIDECYIRHNVYAADYNGPKYTIRDWWEFPMAEREYNKGRTIIKYRGGTMIQHSNPMTY